MQTPLHFETTTKLHSTSSTTSISAHRMHEKRKKNNVLTNHSTHRTRGYGVEVEPCSAWNRKSKNQTLRRTRSSNLPRTHSHDMENMNPKAMALLTPCAHRLQSDHSKLQTHRARTLQTHIANSQSSDIGAMRRNGAQREEAGRRKQGMKKPWARRTGFVPAHRSRAGSGPYSCVCDPKAVAGPMTAPVRAPTAAYVTPWPWQGL